MPHLFYRLDLQPYTWTRFSRVPGPISSVLLACLGRNIQQLAQRKNARRKLILWLLIALCAVMVVISAVLLALNSPYLGWDYSDPETAVVGVAFHAFEWLFVRLAPVVLIGAVVGIVLVWKKM